MRLPNIATDFWQLLSGEEAHAKNPDTFWMPSRQDREGLTRGTAVKLLFEVDGEDEQNQVQSGVERMWVIVSEKLDSFYIGILDSQPAYLEPSENTYLCFGAEIPFMAEHVIDIQHPPQDYVEWQLGLKPERKWPRNGG